MSFLAPSNPPLDSQDKENHISHEEAVNAHIGVYPRRERITYHPEQEAHPELPVVRQDACHGKGCCYYSDYFYHSKFLISVLKANSAH